VTSSRAWALEGGIFREGGAVPITDRGFRYGMSVFETIALLRGAMLFGKEHLTRLREACGAAGFAFPKDLPAALSAWDLSGLPSGMLRIYVSAGDGGPCDPAEATRAVALFDPAELRVEPMRIITSRAPLSIVLGGWKTGNYWPHVQALAEARRGGADEALVFNAAGQLVSAAMANIFLVRDGLIRTPALASGARDGVVRHWVRGEIFVEETILSLEDVEKSDECFLTNSRFGVAPVTEIDGRTLPGGSTGTSLAQSYRETVLRS